MSLFTGAAVLGAALAAGGATAYGASKMSGASETAGATSERANLAAIEEQKRQDAQQKAEFDAQQAQAKAQWDAEQQLRAPYRQAGLSALTKLGDLLGTKFDPSMMQTPAYAPPSANPSMAQAPAVPTMKMNALLPQGGPMSPGARTVIDPTTGQSRVVVNA